MQKIIIALVLFLSSCSAFLARPSDCLDVVRGVEMCGLDEDERAYAETVISLMPLDHSVSVAFYDSAQEVSDLYLSSFGVDRCIAGFADYGNAEIHTMPRSMAHELKHFELMSERPSRTAYDHSDWLDEDWSHVRAVSRGAKALVPYEATYECE